jgi:hypothetical protein
MASAMETSVVDVCKGGWTPACRLLVLVLGSVGEVVDVGEGGWPLA